MTWKFGRQTPDNNLMRFVARRFSEPAVMLDIGSGEGANARELRLRGHIVVTLDKDPHATPDILADVLEWNYSPVFDLIYDINTLCHVEHPPFEKIKSWLKPSGIFFSVCPSMIAPNSIAAGKDFTRFASFGDLREMLSCFADKQFYNYTSPDFRGDQLDSWLVEARP